MNILKPTLILATSFGLCVAANSLINSATPILEKVIHINNKSVPELTIVSSFLIGITLELFLFKECLKNISKIKNNKMILVDKNLLIGDPSQRQINSEEINWLSSKAMISEVISLVLPFLPFSYKVIECIVKNSSSSPHIF